jgi:hypothetical protein
MVKTTNQKYYSLAIYDWPQFDGCFSTVDGWMAKLQRGCLHRPAVIDGLDGCMVS